jgi:hypothetical protein
VPAYQPHAGHWTWHRTSPPLSNRRP